MGNILFHMCGRDKAVVSTDRTSSGLYASNNTYFGARDREVDVELWTLLRGKSGNVKGCLFII
jgi:hypothetical protein